MSWVALAEVGRKLGRAVADRRFLVGIAARRDGLQRADEGGDHLLAAAGRRHADALLAFLDRHGLRLDSARRLAGRELRSAVGPAAAQREVHPQAEFVGLLRGEAQHVQKLGRKELHILDPRLFVVERERIGGLHFEAAEAALFHVLHFGLEPGLGHGGSEPPPADHHPRIVRRLIETTANFIDLRGAESHRAQQHDKQTRHHGHAQH